MYIDRKSPPRGLFARTARTHKHDDEVCDTQTTTTTATTRECGPWRGAIKIVMASTWAPVSRRRPVRCLLPISEDCKRSKGWRRRLCAGHMEECGAATQNRLGYIDSGRKGRACSYFEIRGINRVWQGNSSAFERTRNILRLILLDG